MGRSRAWLGIALVLSALTAMVGSAAWLCRDNTLYRDGHWISTKTRLARFTMGAVSFMVTPTALHYNRLNLGVWHGFHEVLYDQPMVLQKAAFDCLLPAETWVTFVFDKTEHGFRGFRLSTASADPTAWLSGDVAGRFYQNVALPLDPATGWHHVELERQPIGWHLTVDGHEIELGKTPTEPGSCGFRGCLGLSAVDNVVLTGADGNTYRDTFDNYAALPRLLCDTLLVAMGVTLAIGYWVKGPGLVVMHLWLLILAVMLFGVQWFYLGPMHPKSIDYSKFPEYRTYIEAAPAADTIVPDLMHRYGGKPSPGPRVIFVGSSQTWGSGANTDDDTWVRVVERRFLHVQCINVGISGVLSKHILTWYPDQFMALHPQVAVIDLGFNDPKADELVQNVGQMFDINDKNHVKSLLILEPNCPQYHDANMPIKRAALQKLAERRHVPYIDMESWLTQHDNDGFVWWDMVHLTSFGQQLFADRVFASLAPMLEGARSGVEEQRASLASGSQDAVAQ
ncbi:MAG TPA: SGNH/GDSL hydrolase family protein [Candidatus Xenobia bacterium]|jgi:lysophospholipase L1-like esterase